MQIYLIGGFLGSGKTTAIINACQRLIYQNKKVAVITNDQGNQQVDAEFVKSTGITTREVGNGCFCCRYDELSYHLDSLQGSEQPDIIFAESVGSCADLVATIVKPLLKFKPEIKVVVSVFVDANLFASLIEGRSSFLEDSVRYIFKKQLEEADLLILNKTDLITLQQIETIENVLHVEYTGKTILRQNSVRQDDILRWVEALDSFQAIQIRKSLSINYEIYGRGESELAWLDKSIIIDAPLGNGAFAARYFIQNVFKRIRESQSTIGHLKFFLETSQWKEKISFTTTDTAGDVKLNNEDVNHLKMLINARVQTQPELLLRILNETIVLTETMFRCLISNQKESAFTPGFPKPTHRM